MSKHYLSDIIEDFGGEDECKKKLIIDLAHCGLIPNNVQLAYSIIKETTKHKNKYNSFFVIDMDDYKFNQISYSNAVNIYYRNRNIIKLKEHENRTIH